VKFCKLPVIFFICPYSNTFLKHCRDIRYRYSVSGLFNMLPIKRPATMIQRFKILAFLGLLELHDDENNNADNKRLN
jgi:hypothetical protein